MKIAVLGAGAIGCYYGGMLSRAGHDVTMICHRKEQAQAIRDQGMTMITDEGTLTVPVGACMASDLSGSFDLIILITKTIQSRAALTSIQAVLDEHVVVLSLQNGLGNREVIEEFLPTEQILIGMTFYAVDRSNDCTVASHGAGSTSFIDASGELTERSVRLAEVFNAAGLQCTASKDVLTHIWEKVCFNSAANAIATMIHVPMGKMMGVGGQELAYSIVEEGAAIANAAGIPADVNKVKAMLYTGWTEHLTHIPSMAGDYQHGRATEVEFINGGIVREAKKLGLSAPINETMMRLVQMQSNAIGQQFPLYHEGK